MKKYRICENAYGYFKVQSLDDVTPFPGLWRMIGEALFCMKPLPRIYEWCDPWDQDVFSTRKEALEYIKKQREKEKSWDNNWVCREEISREEISSEEISREEISE